MSAIGTRPLDAPGGEDAPSWEEVRAHLVIVVRCHVPDPSAADDVVQDVDGTQRPSRPGLRGLRCVSSPRPAGPGGACERRTPVAQPYSSAPDPSPSVSDAGPFGGDPALLSGVGRREGPALTGERLRPWSGVADAAASLLGDLAAQLPLDLWVATYVDGEEQVFLAAVGPWAAQAVDASPSPWASSFCLRMSTCTGSVAEPDVARSALLAPVAVGLRASVRAYVGAPLLGPDGEVVGSLCGVDSRVRGDDLADVLPQVRVAAQTLSTLSLQERTSAVLAQDADEAWEVAGRDPLTLLLDGRGLDRALAAEEDRAERYGTPAAVLVCRAGRVRERGPGPERRLRAARGPEALLSLARVVTAAARPSDAVGRVADEAVVVVAGGADSLEVARLRQRVHFALVEEGVTATLTTALRRPGSGLRAALDAALHEAGL